MRKETIPSIVANEPERTCRVRSIDRPFSQTQFLRFFWCDACGHELGCEEHRDKGMTVLHKVRLPNYCPNCGAKVVKS